MAGTNIILNDDEWGSLETQTHFSKSLQAFFFYKYVTNVFMLLDRLHTCMATTNIASIDDEWDSDAS